MTTHTVDPAQRILTVGATPITGFAEGTYIKVDRAKDDFTPYVGSTGEGARSRSRDKSGTIEITLMETSPDNDLLAGYAAADRASGAGMLPVTLRDLHGTTEAFAAEAWVQKLPAIEMGNTVGTRVWLIATCNLEMFPGGNVL
jgi:hypothetical protein